LPAVALPDVNENDSTANGTKAVAERDNVTIAPFA